MSTSGSVAIDKDNMKQKGGRQSPMEDTEMGEAYEDNNEEPTDEPQDDEGGENGSNSSAMEPQPLYPSSSFFVSLVKVLIQ